MKWRNAVAIALVVVGSLQMAGYLVGSKVLRGLGAAGVFAPFPKVFCEVSGYEAFAASFFLEGVQPDGSAWSCPLTPERYARLAGPYNRRNVHGATLAFAPRLPEELRAALLERALAADSALLRELGVPAGLSGLRVRIVPRPGASDGPWIFGATPIPGRDA
ncbi:hypothetical protein [Luteolibacter marinus]|uniref:hypothetical protein n=1 Tax=Luteolibacter marinus TaxID=2776705 RepID=UPI0018688987|nr:hypothetical protein [Luteolibacter marinus]